MRRAGQERPDSGRATTATPSATTLKVVGFADDVVEPLCDEVPDDRSARQRALEIAIQQRIQSRLNGRVRNLLVRVSESGVTLEGECTTFYTKQLAQHAAMGILDDELLDNTIVVTVQ